MTRPRSREVCAHLMLFAVALGCRAPEPRDGGRPGDSAAQAGGRSASRSDFAAIAAVSDSIELALGRHDLAGMLRFYDPEAAEYDDWRAVAHGTDEIRDRYEDALRSTDVAGRVYDTKLQVDGRLAVESGQYSQGWVRRDDPRETESRTLGDVLTVWRKNDRGEWRLYSRVLVARDAAASDPAER